MSDSNRIYLVTPSRFDPDIFCPILDDALDQGGIAAVLIGLKEIAATDRQDVASRITGICHKYGIAALLHLDPENEEDSRLVGRSRLDGVHSDAGLGQLEDAIDQYMPDRMVGAGNVRDRHTAMSIGERNPDYLLFGLLDRPDDDTLHPKTFDLATWWAQVFEIPAVALIGRDLSDVDKLAAEGVEFIAAREAAWAHSDGPAIAIRSLKERLDKYPLEIS